MNNPPDAILVGDIHARDDQPTCRLDDFIETQKRKFIWLRKLWEECDRPYVIQSGDLFHRWKSSPQVINMVLGLLPPMITIPGNPGKHNYFNLEGFEKDALKTIAMSELGWDVLVEQPIPLNDCDAKIYPCLWEQEPPHPDATTNWIPILLTHKMILDGPSAFDGVYGQDFLDRMTGYDLIVTGHNHKPMEFLINYRRLVNPGSFTRQSASETHQPRVYLWWAKRNTIRSVLVPIDKDVITREHIDEPKEKDARILAFVERLVNSDSSKITLSFKDNLKIKLDSKEIRTAVKNRLMEVLGDE